jgi:hypothetical protein
MKDNFTLERDILGLMSQHDLKELGIDEVAYIKFYQMKGQKVFVLHAADGTALAVQQSAEGASFSARHHDLDVVSVH